MPFKGSHNFFGNDSTSPAGAYGSGSYQPPQQYPSASGNTSSVLAPKIATLDQARITRGDVNPRYHKIKEFFGGSSPSRHAAQSQSGSLRAPSPSLPDMTPVLTDTQGLSRYPAMGYQASATGGAVVPGATPGSVPDSNSSYPPLHAHPHRRVPDANGNHHTFPSRNPRSSIESERSFVGAKMPPDGVPFPSANFSVNSNPYAPPNSKTSVQTLYHGAPRIFDYAYSQGQVQPDPPPYEAAPSGSLGYVSSHHSHPSNTPSHHSRQSRHSHHSRSGRSEAPSHNPPHSSHSSHSRSGQSDAPSLHSHHTHRSSRHARPASADDRSGRSASVDSRAHEGDARSSRPRASSYSAAPVPPIGVYQYQPSVTPSHHTYHSHHTAHSYQPSVVPSHHGSVHPSPLLPPSIHLSQPSDSGQPRGKRSSNRFLGYNPTVSVPSNANSVQSDSRGRESKRWGLFRRRSNSHPPSIYTHSSHHSQQPVAVPLNIRAFNPFAPAGASASSTSSDWSHPPLATGGMMPASTSIPSLHGTQFENMAFERGILTSEMDESGGRDRDRDSVRTRNTRHTGSGPGSSRIGMTRRSSSHPPTHSAYNGFSGYTEYTGYSPPPSGNALSSVQGPGVPIVPSTGSGRRLREGETEPVAMFNQGIMKTGNDEPSTRTSRRDSDVDRESRRSRRESDARHSTRRSERSFAKAERIALPRRRSSSQPPSLYPPSHQSHHSAHSKSKSSSHYPPTPGLSSILFGHASSDPSNRRSSRRSVSTVGEKKTRFELPLDLKPGYGREVERDDRYLEEGRNGPLPPPPPHPRPYESRDYKYGLRVPVWPDI